MEDAKWSPERKIVGGGVAVLILFIAQAVFPDLVVPMGVEGALGIVTAYLIPDKN